MLAPRLRTALVAIVMVGYTLAVGVPALLLAWALGSATLLYALAALIARFGLWGAGVRISVHGRDLLDPEQNYLFMPNHCSNVDPPVVVVALQRQPCMMAKASLFRIPVFGPVMRAAGFVPVLRKDRQAALLAIEQAGERLGEGRDFVIFPEGTRSRDEKLLPLKKGPFFLALAGGVPVVPIRVRGTRRIMKRGGKVIYRGNVDVEIRPPIPVCDLGPDADIARQDLRRRVRAELEGDLTLSEPRVTSEGHGSP